MNRDRDWWRHELQFCVSAFASLMAVLLVFGAVESVAHAITILVSDLAGGAHTWTLVPDRIGEALAWTLFSPLARVEQFAVFFLGSFLGFRLLIPTFAGAPPRAVAVVVVTWPLAFMGLAIYGDLSNALWFGAIGAVWALVMPLPSKNLLVYGPIVGGLIAGLAFGAFAQPSDGLFFAIVWCAWRLYRRHMNEVAVTAVAAALVPGLLALHDLPSVLNTGQGAYVTIEIAILMAIATAALVLSQVKAEPADSPEPA
jgi:hypothetical protein